jgi:hypothetical protein
VGSNPTSSATQSESFSQFPLTLGKALFSLELWRSSLLSRRIPVGQTYRITLLGQNFSARPAKVHFREAWVRSPPPLPTILLAGRHLPKTRGGKKGQLRPMIRFRFFFGTGDNWTHQPQTSISSLRTSLPGGYPHLSLNATN